MTPGCAGCATCCTRASPTTSASKALAEVSSRSRFALTRGFRAVHGLTPSEYQRQLRLRHARRLLAEGSTPAEAATASGFADQSHLTRWFRRHYGITPGTFQGADRFDRAA
ncbi:helix-turn-helix domain-containing protein [Saccharopolyspora sp. 5N708]|uniref:helix-turn-helix domain-containing protein n=1 Tax=Saccharopolyspora sp. 5N708 TaxID=3457424 RepID=UPI003FD1B71F